MARRLAIVAALLACASIVRTGFAACPQLSPAVSYPVGLAPYTVSVADFNRDGFLDLVTAYNGLSASTGGVSISLGNGNGTFASVVVINSVRSFASATADFNLDGKPDIAVLYSDGSGVAIFLGNGDGTFAAPVTFAVGTLPNSIVVGDFNRDGKSDLAVGDNTSHSVSILLGTGTGTFTAAASVPFTGTPGHIVVGDFNGDAKPDLVLPVSGNSQIAIVLGAGNGTFGAATYLAAGSNPYSLAVGDLNGDGKADVVAANSTINPNSVSILMGNGDGTFAPVVGYPNPSGTYWVAIDDFDGDGKPDVAALNGAPSVSILKGNGNGTVAPAVSFAITGPTPRMLTSADFDRDGRPDIAVVSDSIYILLNRGTCFANCGSLRDAVSLPLNAAPGAVAVSDFDRDGHADIAATLPSADTVSILLGTGTGSFNPAADVPITGPQFVAAGDFNRDGKPDLAVTAHPRVNLSTLTILVGDGGGGFGAAPSIDLGSSPSAISVADFNRDGKPDIAIANFDPADVTILLGGGNSTFGTPTNYTAGNGASSVTAGDLNGDGKPDLAVANRFDNTVSILIGAGDGSFAAPSNFAAGSGPSATAIGDFNRDGKLDIAVTNFDSSLVSILIGNGSGGFAAPVTYATGVNPFSIVVADFDRDGKTDLAVTNNGGDTVSILTGKGDGMFNPAVSYPVGSAPQGIALGDFNGDGEPDLITANASTDVSLLLDACLFAELTVTKTHPGNFAQGQYGVSYTITAHNNGTAATSGAVTVSDTLPAGLTPINMSGSGWNCDFGILTCTRSDALAGGANYPDISLMVLVKSNAPGSVTNGAAVSGGGDINVDNNIASDPTTITLSSANGPTTLTATAISTSQVNVTWDAVTGASGYQLSRSVDGRTFLIIGTPTAPSFSDPGRSANTTYVYEVAAFDGSLVLGNPGFRDLATTILFADDPALAGSTIIKAIHLQQLRAAVVSVSAVSGLTPGPYAHAIVTGGVVRAVDITETLNNIVGARFFISNLRPVQFSTISVGTPVRARYLEELRAGVK